MHKQLEEDRISGAANKPSAEDEFDSRVRESEVRTRPARATNAAVTATVWSKPVRAMSLPGKESRRPI